MKSIIFRILSIFFLSLSLLVPVHASVISVILTPLHSHVIWDNHFANTGAASNDINGFYSDLDYSGGNRNPVGDEFTANVTGVITNAHWLGFYYDDGAGQGAVDDSFNDLFSLNLYEFDNSNDQVGNLLQTTSINVMRVDSGLTINDGNHDYTVYEYTAYGLSFAIDQGAEYLWSVVNDTDSLDDQDWLVATSKRDSPNVNEDGGLDGQYEFMYGFNASNGSWGFLEHYSLAFKLEGEPDLSATVSEPSALLLLGSIFLGGFGLFSFRKARLHMKYL